MITPAEAKELDRTAEVVRQFEDRIDAALKNAASRMWWPCHVDTERINARAIAFVIDKYRAAGWKVELIQDQRDAIGYGFSINSTRNLAKCTEELGCGLPGCPCTKEPS